MAVFGLCQVILTHKDCGLLRHESDFIFHQHQWLFGVLDADSLVFLVTRYDLHGVSAGFGICRLTGYETHKWLIVFAKFIDGRFISRLEKASTTGIIMTETENICFYAFGICGLYVGVINTLRRVVVVKVEEIH